MQDGVQLKYGWIRGGKVSTPVTQAGDVVTAAGGKFVYMSAGTANICIDGTTTIFGFLEAEAGTLGTDALAYNCIIDLTAVFRIPVNSGTYAVGMIGDSCDISDSSNVQGAQLDASTEDLLIVVGGDADNNNWVDVMMNPSKWGTGLGVDA